MATGSGAVVDKLKSAIASTAASALRVDVYPDIFERLARLPLPVPRHVLRVGVPDAVLDHDALFIHVPKNAGTSVSRVLYGRNVGHRSAWFYKRAMPRELASRPTFAVLRDPVDRFVSSAAMLIGGGASDVHMLPHMREKLRHLSTVDAILDWLEASSPGQFDLNVIFRTQSWYVRDRDGRIIVDRLFSIEDDREALSKYVAALAGESLPHANRSDRRAISLSAAQEERVRRHYARDYDLVERVHDTVVEP